MHWKDYFSPTCFQVGMADCHKLILGHGNKSSLSQEGLQMPEGTAVLSYECIPLDWPICEKYLST